MPTTRYQCLMGVGNCFLALIVFAKNRKILNFDFRKLKARSDYTANLLRPAIDGCKIENFPNFRSDLQRPSPLRQSQRPATSVNEPIGER